MATTDQQIEPLKRESDIKDDTILKLINIYQQKSKEWEDSPSTFIWSFDSTGCLSGGDKASSYSCSPMYTIMNVPPGRIEKNQNHGHEHPKCYTEWSISPDRRSVRVVHHNTGDPKYDKNKFLNEIYTFVFEKIPKKNYVFN